MPSSSPSLPSLLLPSFLLSLLLLPHLHHCRVCPRKQNTWAAPCLRQYIVNHSPKSFTSAIHCPDSCRPFLSLSLTPALPFLPPSPSHSLSHLFSPSFSLYWLFPSLHSSVSFVFLSLFSFPCSSFLSLSVLPIIPSVSALPFCPPCLHFLSSLRPSPREVEEGKERNSGMRTRSQGHTCILKLPGGYKFVGFVFCFTFSYSYFYGFLL